MTSKNCVAEDTRGAPNHSRIHVIFQLVVLALLVLLLLNYKGMVGINKVRQTRATGILKVSSLPSIGVGGTQGRTSSLRDSVQYIRIVWPALVFGVLISAAVRTSLSRTPLHTIFGRGTFRDQITGTLAGAPLMLCSCCVAPIFPAMYQRTRRIAPSLALALASPSLNPAALTLSFILFPFRIAGARLLMACVLVLFGSLFVAKITNPLTVPVSEPEEERRRETWGELLSSYVHSLMYISIRTVPLILVGIFVSMLVMARVPLAVTSSKMGVHVLTVAVIALISLLLTLPSLFEIPLALSVIAAGGPVGGAAAVLFAGPAINLPSLLVIGRYSSWKVALSLAGMVWVIAVIGGILVGNFTF